MFVNCFACRHFSAYQLGMGRSPIKEYQSSRRSGWEREFMMLKNSILSKTLFIASALFLFLLAIKNIDVLLSSDIPGLFSSLSPVKFFLLLVFLVFLTFLCSLALKIAYKTNNRLGDKKANAWLPYIILFLLSY